MNDCELLKLLDDYRECVENSENQHRRSKWDPVPQTKEEVLYSLPNIPSYTAKPAKKSGQCCRLFLGMSYWARKLSLDINRFYHDPRLYLETYLKMWLIQFRRFPDDTALTKYIQVSMGVATDLSIFGAQYDYPNDKDPWQITFPLAEHPELLDTMEYPDFYTGGYMQGCHEFYNKIGELVEKLAPDFKMDFPYLVRGPFGVASALRGLENFIIDIFVEPDYAHRLMSYVTESHIRWDLERSKFLHRPLEPLHNCNDDVNCPTVSPSMYHDFILEYERQLGKFYNGTGYYHSCGNLDPLLEDIKTLKPELFHVSSWTNLRRACEVFAGTDTRFEIWMNPYDDVLNADKTHMRKKLFEIADICREFNINEYSVVSGNIQAVHELPADEYHVDLWLETCREAYDYFAFDN